MAYLSSVTDVKVMQQAHLSPGRKRQSLMQPEKAGIVNQGQFESKIRCLEMFDGRQPLDKLRVWTAEQDGYLTVRKATTGESTCTLEKKKNVFVSALLYHENCMYAGMSDGYIRVYSEAPDAVLHVTCDAGRCPLTFDGATNIIAKVRPGSPADVAGFAEGMKVTHVQGQPVKTAEDVRAACEGVDCALTVKNVNKSGETDFELCAEVRKHTGAVTCLAVVERETQDLVFSGGRDWQIYVWSWDATRTVLMPIDIFPGHQNAVRCMTYHPRDDVGKYGGFLYSGGDDNTIRCLDIKAGKEHATRAGFPITMRGSVRALAAYKQHLFSATADGLVQVWNSTEGTHVTTLFPAQPRLAHPSSHAQLCLVVVNNTVWSGGVDGVIRVWRGAGPIDGTNDWQVSELPEHRGAFVNNMSAVQGAADGHVSWHLSDGVVKLLYTESDSASSETDWNHDEGFTGREQELVELITTMRRKMLDNASELQSKASLSDKLEKIDSDRKSRIIKALADSAGVTLKTRYFQKILQWFTRHQSYLRRKRLADTLSATTTEGFIKIYFKKLHKFSQMEREMARKMKFATTLLSSTKKGMQVIYWRKLCEYTNRLDKDNKKKELAHIMFSNTTKGLIQTYHTKCVRWYFRCLQNKKRAQIANGLMAHSTKGVLTLYYYKLIDFARKEKEFAKKQQVALALRASTDNGIRLMYLQKAVRWVNRNKQQKKRAEMAEALLTASDDGLRRIYRKKCLEWLAKRKADELDAKVKELDQKITELERMLSESREYTDEMIAEEQKKISNDMEELEREIFRKEKELEDLQTENSRLKNDLMSSFVQDTSKNQDEQLKDLLVHLKAYGCNCKHDHSTINQCKEISGKYDAFKKTAKRDAVSPHAPEKLFDNGLGKVRESVAEQVRRNDEEGGPKEGEVWQVSTETIRQMDTKLFRQAHLGLKYMIIALDQLVSVDAKHKKPVEGRDEALKNQSFLMTIVARLYEDRHGDARVGIVEADEASEKQGKSRGQKDKLKAARKAQGHSVSADSKVADPNKKPTRRVKPTTASPARSSSPPSASTPARSPPKSAASAKTPASVAKTPASATKTPAKRSSVPDSAKTAAAKKPVSKPVQRRTSKA